MVKQIREQHQEGLAVSLGKLIDGTVKGIGGLLGFAAELERQGKSEYEERGLIEGETKSGKKIKGAYGFKVKVGLNPEDFMGQKRLKSPRRKK